jgi:hypothetical protein
MNEIGFDKTALDVEKATEKMDPEASHRLTKPELAACIVNNTA